LTTGEAGGEQNNTLFSRRQNNYHRLISSKTST